MVNRPDEFERCMRSLGPLPRGVQWEVVEPAAEGLEAAEALNLGMSRLSSDWAVLVHQDVRFPKAWLPRFSGMLRTLSPAVALAGVYGCGSLGAFHGHIADPLSHRRSLVLPRECLTLDEVLIAVRIRSGLRFDPECPGFHCYGADISLQARATGASCVALDAPIAHLSSGTIDASYERAASWLRNKWRVPHPNAIPTPALLLRGAGTGPVPSLLHTLHRVVRAGSRRSAAARACRRGPLDCELCGLLVSR